ncbi:MAG: lipocalin family protein [Rhodobacteraceae bacterium]|nr:lipocalin family protein [Paracoccaceae bacterium]
MSRSPQSRRQRRHPRFGALIAAASTAGALVLGVAAVAKTEAMSGLNGPAVEIDRYIGLWHELGRTPNDFQDNTLRRLSLEYGPCFESTARYAVTGPGRLSIRNACRRREIVSDDTKGAVIEDSADGVAEIVEDAQGRKLKITFGSAFARFIQRLISDGGFDYWIYCLGPLDEAGRYSAAAVSNAEREFLFLLARRADPDPALVEELLTCAKRQQLPVDRMIRTVRENEPEGP